MIMKRMTWNVYRQDLNVDRFEVYNIFKHHSFCKSVEKLIRSKMLDREEFAEAVRKELMYYFWSKSEYELILKNWLAGDIEMKIDIYDQVRLNWDRFIDYLWEIHHDYL